MSQAIAQPRSVIACIEAGAQQLVDAGVAFGHGTQTAFDEAAWLVLWRLNLPLHDLDSVKNMGLTQSQSEAIASLFIARIETRKPAAYLTQEAWLQGVPFYIDERAIVPRSLIAELLCDPILGAALDVCLPEPVLRVLDLCTGNGSLAVLVAMAFPQAMVDATDLSSAALEVAHINVKKHGLQQRIALFESDGLSAVQGRYDLIICNPPYVNSESMARLPAEFMHEPRMALDGNTRGGRDGMDFIRQLLHQVIDFMTPQAVLVLEIGNERDHFEAAFAGLEAIWLQTSAGDEQVLLLTRDMLERTNLKK
jgi:ribosomal protein L3 glutamine methyltransferase